jgi:hypothetical protein
MRYCCALVALALLSGCAVMEFPVDHGRWSPERLAWQEAIDARIAEQDDRRIARDTARSEALREQVNRAGGCPGPDAEDTTHVVGGVGVAGGQRAFYSAHFTCTRIRGHVPHWRRPWQHQHHWHTPWHWHGGWHQPHWRWGW